MLILTMWLLGVYALYFRVGYSPEFTELDALDGAIIQPF